MPYAFLNPKSEIRNPKSEIICPLLAASCQIHPALPAPAVYF
jgi:hypothetical protein